MSIAFMAVATSSMAQSLNKMNWLNEPQQWEIKDGKTLVMDVPAKTDFWRISHYGFTVDDGPFYYATYLRFAAENNFNFVVINNN